MIKECLSQITSIFMAEMEWEILVNSSHQEIMVRIWIIVKCYQIQVTHSHCLHHLETTHFNSLLFNKLKHSTSSLLLINNQPINLNNNSSFINSHSISSQVTKLGKFNTFPRLQGLKTSLTTKESRAAKKILSRHRRKLSVCISTRRWRTLEMCWALCNLTLLKDAQDCPRMATSQEAANLTVT